MANRLPINLGIDDVPGGTGPNKIVKTDDLAAPGLAPSAPVSGAAMSGYDDTLVPPLLGANDVQEAIDALKGGGGAGAPNNATYLTLSVAAGLLNERVFTPGTGLSATDGGAGGLYTLSAISTSVTFVFRPGGVAAGNVYTSWALLYAAMSIVQGPVVLQFDDSIVSPCPIPAGGPYDFSNVSAVGLATLPGNWVTISFDAAAVCSAFFAHATHLRMWSSSVTALVLLNDGLDHDVVLEDCEFGPIAAPGSFFQVDGCSLKLTLARGSNTPSGFPASQIDLINGGFAQVILLTQSNLNINTLSGALGTFYQIEGDASTIMAQAQPGILGAVTYLRIDNADKVLYTPTVATDYAPAPGTGGTEATVQVALDQIVRNGAGHFQKARDPLLTPAPTIYVRTTGNDSTGTGTLLLPFASVARALQSLPAMPEYGGAFPYIDVGPGTFPLPTKINPGGDISISPAPMVVSVAYLIDAAVIVNTKATSTRLKLDTQALAATVPVGTRVRITATTTPGGAFYGVVCRSDNSGAVTSGLAGLVLWVTTDNMTAPYVLNVAAGTSIEILAFGTTFECQDFTEIRGGYFLNTVDFTGAKFTSAGGGSAAFVLLDGCEIDYSNFEVTPFVLAGGLFATLPYFVELLTVYLGAPAELLGGVFNDATYGVLNHGGAVRCTGEMAAIGTDYIFACTDGGSIQADGTVVRAFAGVTQFLNASDPAVTGGPAGLGGAFILGDCLEPRDLAGAVIAGSFTGSFVANVGPLAGVKASIGSASSIVVGLVTNPVAINSVARSTDTSGTAIFGGSPLPGPVGVSYRGVAVDATWSGTTDDLLEIDTTGATRNVNLPAANLVTRGCPATIKKKVTANDLTVTPAGADTIDSVAGALSYNAVYGPGNQGSIRFISDGVSNWSRN